MTRSEVLPGSKIKSKLNSLRMESAVLASTVYLESHREEWKGKLPQNATVQLIIDGLWRQLEQSEQIEKKLLDAAGVQAKQYPETKNFNAIPGIGFIHAATISAILETPHRFANKRKVWMYAGLGLMQRSSGGKLSSEKLTTDYNRLLKCTLIQAAEAAIRTKDNPFRAEVPGYDFITGNTSPSSEIDGCETDAGYNVGDVEKRREVSTTAKRKNGSQTGLARSLF